jgi:hypothetical protein
VNTDLLWKFALIAAVLGVIGTWFWLCGYADRTRQLRAFATRTLLFAGAGLLLGIGFLTSDLGTARPEARLGLIAITVCCFLLVYAAGTAMVASNDQSLVMVNLTGRALLLTEPELAPFFTLPSTQEEPASVLPPVLPRTCYVVSPELARLAAQAGRTDIFTVDSITSTDSGETGPLRIRRLVRVIPAVALAEKSESAVQVPEG